MASAGRPSSQCEPLGLAVLGEEPQASGDAVARGSQAALGAVDRDAAGGERVGAEDRPCQLGAPRALQPGDADDLAGAHL
jgi:hypothetical protein